METPTRTPPPADATRRLLRVDPARIVEFHAVVEGYDDLALVRTLRPEEGLVEAWVSPGREGEFERLRAALAAEGLPAAPVPAGEAA